MTYLSFVVLIPIAALVSQSVRGGWSAFVAAITQTEAVRAIELTLVCSAVAAAINTVFGLATAWVLVRDRFFGQQAVNAIIDLPFALPTVVAGVTFMTLYGPLSPVHVNIAGTWVGITVAIMFVTPPFTVRSVQPVLESLGSDVESAAQTLGAGPIRVFWSVTLPALVPAMLTGAGLAFARAIGEYGSVVFISGNEPYHTEVASSYIYSLIGSGQLVSASDVAILLLLIALAVLGTINVISRRLARRRG